MSGPARVRTDHEAIPRIMAERPNLDKAELLENSDLWLAIRECRRRSPYALQV